MTSDELFGFVNPSTREWRDGLLSSILREQASQSSNDPDCGPRWVVLDGDIDPGWIESLNTLMDDNKVLTLASNERIYLTPQMRLIFEISHLKCATPSTVSRAGILHLNTQDLGWMPIVTSWIESRADRISSCEIFANSDESVAQNLYQLERSHLSILMDKYIPTCLEALRIRYRTVVPMPEFCHLQMLCRILDCLLTSTFLVQIQSIESPREMYELYFAFACLWAFGSALSSEPASNQRLEFSQWWIVEFKAVRFPVCESAPTVFDFFIDPDTHQLVPWTERMLRYDLDPDVPIYDSLFPTIQVICVRYFLDLFINAQQPILLIGPSGSGKTALVSELLSSLSDNFITKSIPMHYYMSSEMLQGLLEKPLEKKTGRIYGPPGNRRAIFFLDDLNATHKDHYGTVQAHTLLRQHLSYGHW